MKRLNAGAFIAQKRRKEGFRWQKESLSLQLLRSWKVNLEREG